MRVAQLSVANQVFFNDYNSIHFIFPDFDHYEKESTKMRDWRFFPFEPDWAEVRMKYTEDRQITNSFADLPLFHCPDLCIQPEDIAVRTRIYEEVSNGSHDYNACKHSIDFFLKHFFSSISFAG